MLRDGTGDVEVGDARLDDDTLAVEVDLEDPVHAGEGDDPSCDPESLLQKSRSRPARRTEHLRGCRRGRRSASSVDPEDDSSGTARCPVSPSHSYTRSCSGSAITCSLPRARRSSFANEAGRAIVRVYDSQNASESRITCGSASTSCTRPSSIRKSSTCSSSSARPLRVPRAVYSAAARSSLARTSPGKRRRTHDASISSEAERGSESPRAHGMRPPSRPRPGTVRNCVLREEATQREALARANAARSPRPRASFSTAATFLIPTSDQALDVPALCVGEEGSSRPDAGPPRDRRSRPPPRDARAAIRLSELAAQPAKQTHRGLVGQRAKTLVDATRSMSLSFSSTSPSPWRWIPSGAEESSARLARAQRNDRPSIQSTASASSPGSCADWSRLPRHHSRNRRLWRTFLPWAPARAPVSPHHSRMRAPAAATENRSAAASRAPPATARRAVEPDRRSLPGSGGSVGGGSGFAVFSTGGRGLRGVDDVVSRGPGSGSGSSARTRAPVSRPRARCRRRVDDVLGEVARPVDDARVERFLLLR